MQLLRLAGMRGHGTHLRMIQRVLLAYPQLAGFFLYVVYGRARGWEYGSYFITALNWGASAMASRLTVALISRACFAAGESIT